MGKKYEGVCRLCGEYKSLSFEHIPPKSAFNSSQRLFQTMEDLIYENEKKYSRFRRGIGKYSLCKECNNLTGSWYGKSFANWSQQGMKLLEIVSGSEILSIPFYIQPLNVLKQVLVMAIASSEEQTITYHSELREMLLNKRENHIPPKYSVHVYFKDNDETTGQPRLAGGVAILKIDSGSANYIEAEVALPPFGYCITTGIRRQRSLVGNEGLCDITWFSGYKYNTYAPVFLTIPIKETHTPLPLDYRTKFDIDRDQEG